MPILLTPSLTGLATSFFNDKNRNIARDLAELMMENKMELPTWLESMAFEAKQMGGASSRRGRNKSVFYYFVKLLHKILWHCSLHTV